MANGRGGYQEPSNPAPVSGPGSLSRRTDGGQKIRDIPNAAYGENKDFRQIQQSAPVSQQQGAQPAQPLDRSGVVGFQERTQRPTEAITVGMDRQDTMREDDLMRLQAYIRTLKVLASMPGASNATRQMVRQLQGATR